MPVLDLSRIALRYVVSQWQLIRAVAEREQLREGLVSAAYADTRITGAAITGSAAVGREDQWSDIDLAWWVAADADLAFWPAAQFGAIAPTFRLLFGTANERPAAPATPAPGDHHGTHRGRRADHLIKPTWRLIGLMRRSIAPISLHVGEGGRGFRCGSGLAR